MKSKPEVSLKYQGEDDHAYILLDGDEAPILVPKNRGIPEPSLHQHSEPLTLTFRLLMLAAVGLAPAGLGALVFAPLAALWTVGVCIRRPLDRADRIRAGLALGISAALLGIAIPLSMLFLRTLNQGFRLL